MQKSELSVGELASRSGVKVSTIHFYEAKGLIFSSRNSGNQRRFSRSTLRRVGVIKAAQNIGISLKVIHEALDSLPKHRAPNHLEWQALSDVWKQELNQRIEHLTKLRDDLNECIGCGCLSMAACPLRNPDDTLGQEGVGATLL